MKLYKQLVVNDPSKATSSDERQEINIYLQGLKEETSQVQAAKKIGRRRNLEMWHEFDTHGMYGPCILW
jgi:hypothetical protein